MGEQELLNVKLQAEVQLLGSILKAMLMLHPERGAVEHLVRVYLASREVEALYESMNDEESEIIERAVRGLADVILSKGSD